NPPVIPPPFPWCTPIPGIPNAWHCHGQPDAPPVVPSPPGQAQKRQATADHTDIFLRHYAELATVPGFAGGGVDDETIIVRVTDPHGDFPSALEGVPVRLAPKIRAQTLVGRRNK